MADDSISKLRLPPHSLEAEQSLLGGLLIDNEALDKVADLVSVKDFYRQDHQIIYKQKHRLIERSQPADIVTVGESLE
jgi:replicative DNA helicase